MKEATLDPISSGGYALLLAGGRNASWTGEAAKAPAEIARFMTAEHAHSFAAAVGIRIVEVFDNRPTIEFCYKDGSWHADSPKMSRSMAEAWAEARCCRAVFK